MSSGKIKEEEMLSIIIKEKGGENLHISFPLKIA